MLRSRSEDQLLDVKKSIALILAIYVVFSCSHVVGDVQEPDSAQRTDGDVKDAHTNNKETRSNDGFFAIFTGSTASPQDKLKDEQDLKMAKLWSRVDQLSSEQSRLRERLKVIEKGLTLGLIPEELKEDHAGHKEDVKRLSIATQKERLESEAGPSTVVIEEDPTKGKSVEAPAVSEQAQELSEKDYQSAVAAAHEQFRAGAYGRAIVEYESIGKKFGEKFGGGSPKFWVARCWINMKEFGTARQILADFLKDYPGSTWAPRAKLELARVEWKLGLRETSLSRLRDVIRDHPQEDAAEMAKMELSTLDKTL